MPFHKKRKRIKNEATGKMEVVKTINPDTGAEEEVFEDENFDFFLSKSPIEAEALYNEYLHYIKMLASKYASNTGLDEEDLAQEAVIGLARASRDFDEERSLEFKIFAIYKMKDALREYVATQSSDINIPQYILDASRLVMKLRKVMESGDLLNSKDFLSIWEQSERCDKASDLVQSVTEIRENIENLAKRSGTSVERLLERAEMYPSTITELDQFVTKSGDTSVFSDMNAEDDVIRQIMIGRAINNVKEHLNEAEYNLLYDHYVRGMTVRELAPELNIEAPSVTVRIHKLLERLQKKEEQILMTKDQ